MGSVEATVEFSEQKKALLAEDEPMMRSVLATYLRRIGLDVVSAVDGVEAVEMFQQHDVDIIVLDCRMPRMNGFRTLKKIRKINSDVPVIAISGDDDHSVMDQFGLTQPNEILIKPVLFTKLRDTVTRWVFIPQEVCAVKG
jgi:CheY-like chemotaxis protein